MSESHPVRLASVLCRRCWSDQVHVTTRTLEQTIVCLECGQIVTNVTLDAGHGEA